MHHPNIEGEHGHGRGVQDQFQRYDGVYVQWHHFVDGYEDRIGDV